MIGFMALSGNILRNSILRATSATAQPRTKLCASHCLRLRWALQADLVDRARSDF
jgi:hypothetical protein